MSECTIDDVAVMTDDGVLDFTQRYRQLIVRKLTSNGSSVPNETKDVAVLAGVLSDMDRQALNKRKLDQEQDSNRVAAQGAAVIDKMLERFGVRDVFVGSAPRDLSALPEIPFEFTDVTTVPGELDIGMATQTYDEFVAAHEASPEHIAKR